MDLLLMYRNLSGFLQAHVQNQGELSSGGFAMMKAVRKEILKLIAMWISKSETPRQQIMADFIPPLMQAVLEDYQTSHPKAREDEVLNCMAVVVSALREHITPVVLDIFASVFNPTLDMISDVCILLNLQTLTDCRVLNRSQTTVLVSTSCCIQSSLGAFLVSVDSTLQASDPTHSHWGIE